MRISFQLAFIVFVGFGAIYAGASNIYSPSLVFSVFYNIDLSTLNEHTRIAIETQSRLLAGMWLSAGIFSFMVVKKFEENTSALRLIFLGMTLGSIGELASVVMLNGDIPAAVIKDLLQIGVYLGLELWRVHMCKRVCRQNNHS